VSLAPHNTRACCSLIWIGVDADIDTEVIPAATLTYVFNKNLAVELFCCFAGIS